MNLNAGNTVCIFFQFSDHVTNRKLITRYSSILNNLGQTENILILWSLDMDVTNN